MLRKLLVAILLLCALTCQAAVYSLPWGPKPQFLDSNGAPMSGGTLTFYIAGSTTPQNTYTDSTGAVANSNPITLNVRGETPNEVWLTGGVGYKLVLKDSFGSTVWTVDSIRGINDTTVTIDQWVAGPAPTYVSATSFTLSGDQTLIFTAGRRIKTINSGGTIYSTIKTSTFGALTTITVLNDSGILDSGLSAVSYGLLSAVNPSSPLLTDSYPIVSGTADTTKKIQFALGGLSTNTTRTLTVPDADIQLGNWSTGDVKLTLKTVADAGWVLMNDTTIGDASSGATGRANADTSALFILLWNNTANADCAVSGGRGANAAADYAAHKTIALPKALGRALATYGAGAGLTSRALANVVGEEAHTITSGEMTHTHGAGTYQVTVPSQANSGSGGSIGTAGTFNVFGTSSSNNAPSGTAMNVMQPTLFLNTMLKL